MTNDLDLPFAKRFPHVKRYVDHTGERRYYFRLTTPKTTLPDYVTKPEAFAEAHKQCMQGLQALVDNVVPNSLGALIVAFMRSAEYPDDQTSDHYKKWTKILLATKAMHGDKSAAGLKTATVKEWHLKKAKTAPSVADEFLWVGRKMYQWAKEGDKFGVTDNPFIGLAKARSKKKGTKGRHHSWTRAEIAQYFAKWPEGTQEHLAVALALYAGFRLGDLVRIGRWAVRAGRPEDGEGFAWYWDFTQDKLSEKHPQQQGCPLHPELVRVLKRTPGCWDAVGGRSTFLRNKYGHAWANDGFSDWFLRTRKAAGLAGGRLPNGKRDPLSCTIHGVRHAAAGALADRKCTNVEIAAFLGHENTQHVDDYIKRRNRKAAGESAMKKLARGARAGIVRKLIGGRSV